jgi:hypothetical protein
MQTAAGPERERAADFHNALKVMRCASSPVLEDIQTIFKNNRLNAV